MYHDNHGNYHVDLNFNNFLFLRFSYLLAMLRLDNIAERQEARR